MKFLLLLLLSGCSLFSPKPPDELEEIAEEVIKKKTGVDIEILPEAAKPSGFQKTIMEF